jgi:type IV pilus assembly protein PilY1
MTSAINTFLRQAARRLARLRILALVSGYLMLGMAPAFADDIDVYTKSVASGGGGAPTITFLIDSSGSMQFDVDKKEPKNDPWSAVATHLLQERRFLVQDAMRGQLTSMPGRYKVGLFRYSGSSSGLKLADAISLGTVLSSSGATGGVETIYIRDGVDDVAQVDGKPVRMGEPTLNMSQYVETSYAPVAAPLSGSWTVSGGRSATDPGNPVYYYQHTSTNSLQTFYLTSTGAPTVDTYLYLVDDATGNVLGQNDDTAGAGYTCPAGWDLYNTNQCRRYCSSSDVKNGVPGCTNKNKWNYIAATYVAGNLNSTLVYNGLVKDKWYRVVAATYSIGMTGSFTVDISTPGNGQFYAPGVPSIEEQQVGLRFTGIKVPQGAVINSAYLKFEAAATPDNPASLAVGMDSASTPADFLSQDLFSRDVLWQDFASIDFWNNGEFNADTTFNVTDLIQKRSDDSEWCSGEVVLLVKGTGLATDVRIAKSFEQLGASSSRRPQLIIDWSPGAGGGSCNTATMTFDIKTMTEDVYQRTDGTISFSEPSLLISDTQKAGLRFTMLPIPPGVQVTSAKLELVAHTTTTPKPISINAFSESIAKPFGAKLSSLDQRELSETTVSWTPTSWVAGQRYLSPELKDIVGPLFSGAGWERDGAIGILLQGSTASTMQIRAWERTVSGGQSLNRSDFGTMSARLHVTFTSKDPLPTVKTHRRKVLEEVESLLASGGTPISGAYLELAQYLLGRDGYTMPEMATGACANNTAIVLTDGFEEADYSSAFTTSVKDITGKNCSVTGSEGGAEEAWPCTYAMMDALYEPEKFGAVSADGNYYSVATHTVGFGPIAMQGGGKLNASGVHGGGDYYPASNAAALIDIFNEIIASIVDAGATIAAPGVAVNALNRFRHLDELYYSLFKPSTKVDWKGNLKRYRFKDGDIVDVHGNLAVDNVERIFTETSQSWWSEGEDGVAVTIGGAAAEITTPDTRKLYTYLGANGESLDVPLYDVIANKDGVGAESVEIANTFITPETVGINYLSDYATMTGAQLLALRDQVVAYARGGTDVLPKQEFGSAIHGSPLLVTYGFDGAGDAVNTVFVGDNQGILHMIDTGGPSSDTAGTNLANTGGKELFAFIPQELLPNLATLERNEKSVLTDGYVYGLDGAWVAWKYDKDGDQIVEPGNGDHVYLYGGMRRGGKNVYALDVSSMNRTTAEAQRNPRLLWVVEGGKAGTEFENMGQSWSDPSPRWIRWKGERRRVVFFGGGYDAAVHDNNQSFTNSDQLGRQLYMVDATTGELLWWASNDASADTTFSDMRYSITAAPTTVDRNANGYVDGIYVVDLAGQIIRFDVSESATKAGDFVKNTVLVAKLGATADGASSTADNRRFYDAPALAFVRVNGSNDVVIALSSGYREEPLDDSTVERFFSIRDVGGWSSVPPSNATVTIADLASADAVDQLTVDALAKPGWYLTFSKSDAEKGMGTPVIFDFAVLFSAYVPRGATAPSACTPDIGISRLYFMDILTATGLVNRSLDNASADGRYLDSAAVGIASRVQLLITDDGIAVLMGTKGFGDSDDDGQNDLEDPDAGGGGGGGEDARNRWRLSADDFGKIRRAQWYEVYDE